MCTTNVYEYIKFTNVLILFIYSIELRIMFTLRHINDLICSLHLKNRVVHNN